MDIRLTEEQYREIIKSFLIGQYAREIATERDGGNADDLRPLESFLLSFAPNFKAENLVRSTGDALLPAKELEAECFDIMDEYDEDRFWHRLEQELGERDFWETASASERGAIEATGMWPDRVKESCRKYHREFHAHGIDRLRLMGSPRDSHSPTRHRGADDAKHDE